MWLKLNIQGTVLYFQIKGYASTRGYSDAFCDVTLHICCDKKIDIWSNSGLCFEDYEVDYLRARLEALINRQVENEEIVDFMEPEIEFYLKPESGEVELRLYFWYGALTDNYLSLNLSRENAKNLLSYLELVTKIKNKKDNMISDLIDQEIILDYQN